LIRKKFSLWLERARASLVASFANSARCHRQDRQGLRPRAARPPVARHNPQLRATLRNNGGMPMPYVDGFIVAVPKKNLGAYRSMAKKAGKIWREHGALDYREWVAEDVKVGKLTSFPRSVKLKPGETVIFSWITYKSRAQRDRVNAKVMADKRLTGMMDTKSLPFDAKRMIYGGFESLVKA
jgi:uncharacterized protein YbaA (DUF1428 family)